MIDDDDNLPHRAATDIVPAVDLRADLIAVHERAVRAERAAAVWKRAAKRHREGAIATGSSYERACQDILTVSEAADKAEAERDAALAENARLREAAVILDNHAYCTACSYDQPCRHTPMVDQARAVLGLTAEQQQPRGDDDGQGTG